MKLFHLVECGLVFLTFFVYVKSSNICRKQIFDKTGQLTIDDVNRYKSEINTWEAIITSVISSCWSLPVRNDGCNTKFLLFKGDSEYIFNYVKSGVWLLGNCGNTSILLYSTQKEKCNVIQIITKAANQTTISEDTDTQFITQFMSHMLQLFFNSAVNNNYYYRENWNSTIFPGCGITAGILAVPISSKPTDNQEVLLTSSRNEITQKNSSDNKLTKHHGHGGITDAVLTIICAVCGSTALSLLLFFRRIRSCICNICHLCKDSDRLLSNMEY